MEHPSSARNRTFGSRRHCPLRRAERDGVVLADLLAEQRRQLFSGACGHASCSACGPRRARRELTPLGRATETITAPALHVVLRGPVVRVARKSECLDAVKEFLSNVDALADGFTYRAFGDIPFAACATEWTCMNTAQARPHAHVLAQVTSDMAAEAAAAALVTCWVHQLGGEFQGEEATDLSCHFATKLGYLMKGPLGKHYGTNEGSAAGKFLLDPFEDTTGSPAAIYPKWSAYNPWELRCGRARVRHRAIESNGVHGRGRFSTDAHYGARAPALLASLRAEHRPRCPTCRRANRVLVHRRRPALRWRCGRCGKTFSDRPVMESHEVEVRRRRRAGQIRWWRDEANESWRSIQQLFSIGRQRAQELYRWHLRTYP